MKVKPILIALIFFSLINSFAAIAQTKQIDSLNRVLSKMPDDTNKVKTLRLLFIEIIDKQDPEKAIPIALRQLSIAKKIGYEKGQASAYKLLSVGYESAGDVEKSIESSLNGLKICEKLHDNAGMASAYSNIGLVYLDENELNDALNYFKKSLDVFGKMKNKPENVWRSFMNIGRTYEQQHNDDGALKSYLQSLTISKTLKKNQNIFMATSLYHIGDIYFNRKEYAASEDYLTQAIKLIPGAQQAYPVAEIYLLFSKIDMVQNRFQKALEDAKKGLAIVKVENYKAQLAENYRQLANVYAVLKDYNNAYHFETQYITLKDSLVNAQSVRKLENLQYNYKLEKKELVTRELLKDKKLTDLTIQRQYIIGAFIGIGLLTFLLLSVFYYKALKSKTKDNELLHLQQQEILEQNAEITAQNEEISNQKEHLTQLNNTKNKLFSIISHDLRAPVLTLQDALTMFNDEMLTHEEITAISGELLGNVTNTSAMLDNVLYWAKSQLDGININKGVFDIRHIVLTNMVNFKKQAEAKNISLVNTVDQRVDVLADASNIDIVLRNLLSNAIKFCSAGDTITVSAAIKKQFLCVSVTDTGKGISKEVQKRLFDPADFYSTYGTANETGTGLGINLCRDFIILNGGSIGVESEPGKGSTFTFTVPLA